MGTTLLRRGDDPATLTERYRRGQSLAEYRAHAVVGGPQEVLDTYGRLIDAGMDYIIVADIPGLAHIDILEYLGAEVLPALRSGLLPVATACRGCAGRPAP